MRTAGRYSIAVLGTVIAFLLTAALAELMAPMRLFFFWCAVLAAAVIGGSGPALLAVALSLIGSAVLIFEPIGSIRVANPVDILRMTMFAAFSGAISYAVAARRKAEQRAAALADRAAFINRASEALSSSLGTEATMRNLAQLCIPAIADSCAVDLGTDENYERIFIEHVDRSRVELIRELDRRVRTLPGNPVVKALESGQPQLIEDASALPAEADPEAVQMARELRLHSLLVAPLKARGRTIGALMVVYNDSSRRYTTEDVTLVEELARRAAMALDNARLFETAEAANRAKDEFLATLSHELRTPLTAISGWAHMLQVGIQDEDTRALAVGTILSSAKTQGELIDDLLDLSRVVAGNLHMDIVSVDLTKVIEEVSDAVHPAADAKGIAVSIDRPPEKIFVRGDERRLRQIVWNLLSNAVKFTEPDGSVKVAISRGTARACVDVVDTGRGIEPSFLPYVFDRFRQADSSTSRVYGGLGLGLAVVRHLVELHGGTVRGASEGLGKGATFSFELPLAREDEAT
ncbi:MAG TPA: ATP-binding protein [Thermoanaerobaculia bacterium]|nr:ATP-binding protein [Thermoanaerobaculia bacterium]